MKKILLLPAIVVLFTLSVSGCFKDNSFQIGDESKSMSNEYDTGDLMPEAWQEAYIAFLEGFSVSADDITEFSLRDLDNNGIPELIIIQTDENAMNALLTAYSFDGNVIKIGEYSNPKESFAGGFRFSNNPMFPGLFEVWWGEGVEHYGYLTMKDEALIYEYVLRIDRTTESPYQENISSDKQLINESIDVNPPYEYTDNLLEIYPINTDNIIDVIGEGCKN